jgi:hypothetical protein
MSHRILQHFRNPQDREPKRITDPYESLALILFELLDEGPEKTQALERLLESRDWAIRAHENDKINRRHDMLVSAVARSVDRTKPGMVPQQAARS